MAKLIKAHIKTVGELLRVLEKYDEAQDIRILSNLNASLCAMSVIIHPIKGKVILYPETKLFHRNINKEKKL